MDHQIALNTQAVERYTLSELTSPEREAFEEHFFSCPDCITALREYEIFVANTRAVFKEDAQIKTAPATSIDQPGWWSGFRNWFAIPAVALAGLALAFVMLRNPQQPAPDPNGPKSEWALVTDARDGAVPHHSIAPGVVWLAPSLKLQGLDPNRWIAYHWEVRDEGGKLVDQGDGHGGENPLKLKIPASKFVSLKTYKLTVQGDAATGPMVSSFIIERN